MGTRPAAERCDVVGAAGTLGAAELVFERFLPLAKLRQAVVEQRQVGWIDVHRQRRHCFADLLELARDAVGVADLGALARGHLDEPLDGGVERFLVGENETLELVEHPGFQLLGAER